MTKQEMLNTMCLVELSQADVKAIGRCRGFEAEVVASRALLQHVFLSEQGVREALASLTEMEILGLHLLNHRAEAVGVEFFKRVYPGSVTHDLYLSHTARYKGLLQLVKTNLVRRGVLVFCALPQRLDKTSASERLRFCFPDEFSPFLPTPFQPRRLAAAVSRQYRKTVVPEKLAEILELERAPVGKPSGREEARWRLANGELLFGGKPFAVERFKAWPATQLAESYPGAGKEQAEGFRPVSLLLYALFRLGENEWLAPGDLLPIWKLGLPGGKAPEPRTVCEAGFDCGLLEKVEEDGTSLYRWRGLVETAPDAPPDDFLEVQNPDEIRIDLARVPLEGLERLNEVARLRVAEGSLWAAPSLLKISHAPAATLQAPIFRWLQENHAAFRAVVDKIEQKRGHLIVHENLAVAKVNDPALRVMLEKEFGTPGQLVALSSGYIAFPSGLLPQVQSWMKKSGHVIKTVSAHDTD
ncbi:MAG: hypothetical protein HY735_12500 [Verrucomicrobia bacterium]|nr:hypothetical protein [Verrucomicrobiota bacterium]